MFYLTRTSEINFSRYLNDLRYLGFIYVDIERLEREAKFTKQRINSLAYRCSDIMKTKSGCSVIELNKRNIFRYLIDHEYCPERKFEAKNVSGMSLEAGKVLKPLLEEGYAEEFLTTYMQYTSLKSINGLITGITERAEKTDLFSASGARLYKVYTHINEADNRRTYYSNENLQNIPKEALTAIEPPKGYTLVSGDFAQSDLRIAYSLFLKTDENDKVMEACSDKYEAFFRILLGEEFDLEDFKENRKDYKVDALAPLYGSTSGKTEKSDRIVKMANKYLPQFPKYAEFKRRIQKTIDLGLPIKVSSYFGDVQTIDDTSINYYGSTLGRGKHIVNKKKLNKALNAPIQTGTSEIVIATARSIMDDFKEIGATPENEGIYCYLNRHDELIFMVKNEYLPYSYIFQKHEKIIVDDWIPLEIGFSFTDKYTEENEELDAYAKSYYKDEVEVIKRNGVSSKDFIPAQDVLRLYIGTRNIGNSTVICYYSTNVNKVYIERVDTTNNDEILTKVYSTITNNSDYIKKELQCNSVVLGTQLVGTSKKVFTNILINAVREYDPKYYMICDRLVAYGVLSIKKSLDPGYVISSEERSYFESILPIVRNGVLFE